MTSKCSASNIDGDQVGFAQFAPAAAVQDTANRSNTNNTNSLHEMLFSNKLEKMSNNDAKAIVLKLTIIYDHGDMISTVVDKIQVLIIRVLLERI